MNNKDQLRVLLVSPIGEIGGAEQVILKIAERLPEHDVAPILACLRPGPLVDRARQQGLEVHTFREHRMRQVSDVFQGIAWLRKLIHLTGTQVVHANYTSHLYASPASRLAGVPEIWHIHDFPNTSDAVNSLQMRLPTSHVIFTTQHVRSGYPRLHSVPHSIIPPTCIDPAALKAFPAQPDIRKRHDLPEGPLLLTVARLQAHKGHKYLIDAIPQVLALRPDAQFAIVGKAGSTEQASYQRGLEAQCRRLGILDAVRFLDYVEEADLISLFREATALVHPALTEGFGLTLLEAMALGVPVIAAAADGPKELITHRENGLLVSTASSTGLADAILEVITNPQLAKLLQDQGKFLVAQKSLASLVIQTVEVYRKVAELAGAS